MHKKVLIKGMTCASCVSLNQNSLSHLKGVSKVAINLATNMANIDYDEKIIDFTEIQKAIESNGFGVEENIETNKSEKKNNKVLNRFIFSLVFSIPVFSMMFGKFMIGIDFFGVDLLMYIYAILSAIVVFGFGGHYHSGALKALKKMHFNMDSLVSLGTLTALIYSIIAMFFDGYSVYFEASVSIITLINLGKYLEAKAKSKAGDAISKLLELGVKKAYVLVGENMIEKDIDDIKEGEIVVVKAGEKIALDGIIVSGGANVDESMLTGESIPVYKEIGSECFGSTINLDGNLNVKVTKTNANGTLANIIKLVDNAQSSKAPIEHLADKISGVFVPVIIVISIITFVVWYLVTGDISQSIVPAVAALVIACPCALGLATPTAIMVGTGVGASHGILIKNAETLEKTKDIDIIVFDKTGTLTNGKPEVTDIINIGKSREELIQISKSLSVLSHHPLSKSIANYDNEIKNLEVSNFEEIRGKGVVGEINGKKIKLGNKKLFEKISDEINIQIDKLTIFGKTPIIVGDEFDIYGIIGLIDLPKTGVIDTIKNIQSKGIKVVMLTGDTKKTSEYIASQIGIDTVISEVMPGDKLQVISDLQANGNKVAFVGDGINDAPALVKADLSIAMGTGSDIAMESSDIVLVKGNLEKVVTAIDLSRRTLYIIKQNLFWAFVYNSIGIPLAVLGILNPIFASFAMSMSSVSVVSNSLRLKLFK
ncbi:MAG: heavy metal translocating P-type ATPase [Candidatus Gracilibacteria bacterium]|nr:heavy metal translocating P-type ATPase [Candidatus Gracilibacteria bacterium]